MLMGRCGKLFLSFVLAMLVFSISPPVLANDQPYNMQRHHIEVIIRPDGSATLVETLYLNLKQDLPHFSFILPLNSGQTVHIEQITVADMLGGLDKALFVAMSPADASDNQNKPMTYHLRQQDNRLIAELHLFFSAGSERTITLTYTIDPLVYRHGETAFLQHAFFQPASEQPIGDAILQLTLPEPVDTEQVWVLPSSLTSFSRHWDQNTTLVLTAQPLDTGHVLLLTCLLPAATLKGAPQAVEQLPIETLREQALGQDADLHGMAGLQSKAHQAVFILLGLAVLLFFIVYWFYDREGAYPDKIRYQRDVPSACPPVILALLVRRKRPSQLILTILLSLVDKGYLILDGSVFSCVPEMQSDLSQLSPSEQHLLQWFFTDLATDQTLSLAQVRRYARHEETAPDFRRQFAIFRSLLDKEMPEQGYLDRAKTFRGRLTSCVTALAYALLAALITVFLNTGIALLLLIPAVGFLLYSGMLRRLTNRGRENYAHGQALARYLRRLHQLPPYPEATLQRRFIAYAMALGLVQPYLQVLPEIWSSQPVHDQLAVFGISRQKKQPLKQQVAQFAADLRVMDSLLSSSLLISEHIRR